MYVVICLIVLNGVSTTKQRFEKRKSLISLQQLQSIANTYRKSIVVTDEGVVHPEASEDSNYIVRDIPVVLESSPSSSRPLMSVNTIDKQNLALAAEDEIISKNITIDHSVKQKNSKTIQTIKNNKKKKCWCCCK